MERPGRPRAALGNSPARASKNRLGCATLVLQITPADQAARTAARTEHPSIPSPRPAGCEHCLGREHRRGYSGPDGLGQEPGTSPQEPIHLQSTPADHVHTGPGRRAQAQPRQGGGSRSSTAGSRRQRTIARRGRRRRNHGLGQSGATLPTRVADQYLLTISYHEIPTSPTRCTWPSDCESAKAHRRNGPRRRSKGRRKAHREFSSTPRKGN